LKISRKRERQREKKKEKYKKIHVSVHLVFFDADSEKLFSPVYFYNTRKIF
jgi:hypothetical protein